MMKDPELALLMDRLMRRIHSGLQSRSAEFDTYSVGPGGGMVLMTLGDTGCIGLAELTQRVARDKSQITRTIKSLENKGLVMRQASETDGRVSLVSLTEAGETVVEHLVAAVTSVIGEIMDPLPEAEQTQLKDLLRRVV